MNKTLLREFLSGLDKLNEKEYLLSMVAYSTAPTLKGIKPASLMSLTDKGRNSFALWQQYKNEICKNLGLCSFELREKNNQSLVLFYNEEMLNKQIASAENQAFLMSMGYNDQMTLIEILEMLKSRCEAICPHEIGIFLGIPVEDVLGFMKHKGKECLFCSYWKVYHEPCQKQILFKEYDMAKNNVASAVVSLAKGLSKGTVETVLCA